VQGDPLARVEGLAIKFGAPQVQLLPRGASDPVTSIGIRAGQVTDVPGTKMVIVTELPGDRVPLDGVKVMLLKELPIVQFAVAWLLEGLLKIVVQVQPLL